jgi:hypothetical protein
MFRKSDSAISVVWPGLLVALSVLALEPSHAQGPGNPMPPNPTMAISLDNNKNSIELSSALPIPQSNPQRLMPEVWMPVAVRCRSNGEVSMYQTVQFFTTTPNLIVLSATSAQTDQYGRCRIQVKGKGRTSTFAAGSVANVTAKWVNVYGQTVLTRTASVRLVLSDPFASATSVAMPWPSNAVYQARPNPEWKNLGAGKMYSPCIQAASAWNVPGKLNWFQTTGTVYQLGVQQTYDPRNPGRAWTFPSQNPVRMYFNMAELDGNHYGDKRDRDHVMPLEWRPANRATAIHEFGHALRLGHASNRLSTMFEDTSAYFYHLIEYPTAADIAVISNYY